MSAVIHRPIIALLIGMVWAAPAQAQFTIPNVADAYHTSQAQLDTVDLNILAAGIAGNGVLSGAGVTAQGSPDMTVAVAAGTVRFGETYVSVSSGNATITTADGTHPRFDLVVVNTSGTKSVTAGTPAASPAFPSIPANSIVLAAVYVPASDTTIAGNQITDKRVLIPALMTRTYKLGSDYTNSSTTGTEITGIGPMSVTAAGSYHLSCLLIAQTAATGTGIDLGVNYTGTVTEMAATLNYPDTGSTATGGNADGTVSGDGSELIVAHASALTESTTAPNLNVITGVATANQNFWLRVDALLTVSDTGDLELWAATDVNASQVTVQSGSFCAVRQL